MKKKDKIEGKIANTKDKYVEKREAEIDKWNTELEDLDDKIMVTAQDAKAKLEHKEHINALRQKRDEAKVRLAEIKAARDNKWEDLKDGLESFRTSITDGFEKVKAKF